MTITKQDLIDEGCDPRHIDDWVAYRKFKKKPEFLSETALKAMKTAAKNAGIDLPKAVELCAGNEWIGFQARYMPFPPTHAVQANMQPQTDRDRVRDGLRDINKTDW